MPETTTDQEQQKNPQQTSETGKQPPTPLAPQPELDALPPALSLGPGLGSPDGFEKRAGDERLRRGANQVERAQTMTAMQRQFGNQHVQRFMAQRRAAGGPMPVQREGDKDKDAGNTLKIDEKGVTNAKYNPPTLTTSNEVPTPSADAKPGEDKVDVTATVTAVFAVTTKVSMPSAPTGLKACQAKRVKDALARLKAHEDQHVAAMKQYDGSFSTTVTVTGVTRAAAPAALIAAAKPAVDAEGATRKKTAQDASDALDQPEFVIIVDMDCDGEKADKKDVGDTGAQPEMAGGGEGAQPDAGGGGQ